MYQFIETICYKNGLFERIDLHNNRLNRTRHHFFGNQIAINLLDHLKVPQDLTHSTVKCTVTYSNEIEHISYSDYQMRAVNSLKLIDHNLIDYSFKYANREELGELYSKRGECDDILIVKDGFLTDSFYANLVLLRENRWYSMLNPLLLGTRLLKYVQESLVTPVLVSPNDLHLYSEARIINAMISIENSPIIPIQNINY
jgi:4-amino-4-deoxychorismate lyase